MYSEYDQIKRTSNWQRNWKLIWKVKRNKNHTANKPSLFLELLVGLLVSLKHFIIVLASKYTVCKYKNMEISILH